MSLNIENQTNESFSENINNNLSNNIETETNTLINIITQKEKENPNFKNNLAYLSRSDAHHDLKDLFKDSLYKSNTKISNAFNSGIPVPAVISYHEGEAFASIILSVDNEGNNLIINGEESKLQKALTEVPDCTTEYTGKYSIFEVGIQNLPIFKYKVTKFITKCSNNKDFKDENLVDKACKNDFGKNFVENTKLGEDGFEAAIIVDFSQHHFMEQLVTGAKTEFQIHYLMTPEVVNDPAGKPNVNNKTLFDVKDNGVRLKSYVQTDNSLVTYTKFDETDSNPSNNFFSNYDFTLSPIKQIFTKQKAEKLITTLTIKYDNGNGKPLSDIIEDSKGENSITTVLGYLKKILKKIIAGGDESDTFNFNSKCQQKRGGDWFQALTCIDARNRDITQILPLRGESIKLSENCPVYLVTHDRIAVTYALLNGVNVIYLDYYGRIFIFKNFSDNTLKSSGKPMEEIIFEGIQKKWHPSDNNNGEFIQLLSTGEKYLKDRNSYLNGDTRSKGKIIDFQNYCHVLEGNVNNFDFNIKNPIGEFQKLASITIQEMFKMAVELRFININLIDITNDIEFVKYNLQIFSENYKNTSSFKSQINKFSKSLNNIKGIQDKFGVIATDADFYNAFGTWVAINVPKLDVYKSAGKLLEGTGTGDEQNKTFDFSRFISFFNKTNKDERKVDSHIFLPFIQDLDNNNKAKIISVLLSLTTKTEQYFAKIKSVDSSSRFSRRGTVSPNEIYYNKLANLIYESFIFIKNDKPIDPVIIDPIFLKTKDLIIAPISTDNILLASDKAELDIFKIEGKNSNYTDNVADFVTGGSSYINSFISSVPGKKINAESVICDISVKQIIWPLLTTVLLENGDTSSISNFIKQITQYIPDVIQSTGESELKETSPENNPIVSSLIEKIRQTNSLPQSGYVGGSDDMLTSETKKTIINLDNLANNLYNINTNNPTSKTSSNSSNSSNLMLDFNLGYHPLVPIYTLLTAYYNTLGNQCESDPFFYTYFTYINILEKMKDIIEKKYLDDTSNYYKTASAYLIGFGLNTLLIKSNTSLPQNNEILDVINISQSNYYTFSLKNDSFAGLITGSIHQTPDEEILGMVLVNNKLFKNFIVNEVNIKDILETGTSVDNLPNYEVLKDRIFNLLGEINSKVNYDRGTSLTILGSQGVDNSIYGISSEERAKRASLGQQKYDEIQKKETKSLKPFDKSKIMFGKDIFSYSSGSDENTVKSTTSSSKSKGGKKTRRHNKYKKNTRRQKKIYKSRSKKQHKIHKKTIKH